MERTSDPIRQRCRQRVQWGLPVESRLVSAMEMSQSRQNDGSFGRALVWNVESDILYIFIRKCQYWVDGIKYEWF